MSSDLWESHFLTACRGQRPSRVPVWLMRQAGRYMREYREVRAGRSFLELCQDVHLASEVTVHAQGRIDADAAIIFADILLILQGLGMPLEYVKGDGPVLARPLRRDRDVAALGDPQAAADACGYVAEAVALTRRDLPSDVPLIGFCGAPFTLASYAIEGGGSRQFARTRQLMYEDTATWHRLSETLVAASIPYARAQIDAGAQAFQIFDSWAGALPRADYRELVWPHLHALAQEIPEGIPLIIFGTNTGHLLGDFRDAGADVVGIDAVTDMASAWKGLGGPQRVSVQGNLDPGLLLAPRQRLLAAADRVLAQAGDGSGYIFNLGHGVFKETDVERVIALIDHVHQQQLPLPESSA
ncbi:MAG: uroporphyrinogen decarboxylase [Planctomycetota bacterium]|nr:MAG: uroporphyrinogen decarboxylase [Planctomycetota bacterium]